MSRFFSWGGCNSTTIWCLVYSFYSHTFRLISLASSLARSLLCSHSRMCATYVFALRFSLHQPAASLGTTSSLASLATCLASSGQRSRTHAHMHSITHMCTHTSLIVRTMYVVESNITINLIARFSRDVPRLLSRVTSLESLA